MSSYTKVIVHTLAGPKNYVFVGNVPKHVRTAITEGNANVLREYYGSTYKEIIGADEDFGDLEELLGMAPAKRQTVAPPTLTLSNLATEYIYDVIIRDDSMMDLKAKVAMVTGIPVYCQHMYWMLGEQYMTTYDLLVDNAVTLPDIRGVANDQTTYIDQHMYQARDYINIKAKDTFIMATEQVYHVHDLRSYNHIIMAQEQELIYFGFVLKYWPMVTQTVFNLYISNYHAIRTSYPLLDPDPVETARVANYELKLSLKGGAKPELTEGIFSANIRVTTNNTQVNIRNVFDGLHTSPEMPEVHAYLKYENTRYFIKKYYSDTTRFPSVIGLNNGLVCMLSGASPIFVTIREEGFYEVSCKWVGEAEVTFKNIISILSGPVNALIAQVNRLNAPRLNLNELTTKTAQYRNMDAALFWKRVMNEKAFVACIGLLDVYISAHVMQKKETTEDGFFYMFRKGITRYDTAKINSIMLVSSHMILDNQYEYMTSSSVLTKWNQLYSGKITKMSHRTVDIRFDIYGVYEEEFEIFKKYMESYVRLVEASPEVAAGLKQSETVRKLKKLKEEDPVLYSLKKMGSSKGYSKICQKPRQPTAYNEAEYKALGSPKNCVKYWNFTTKSPMYYTCPSKKHPVLGFVGYDKHPQNFCAPCCNKRTTTNDTKRQQIKDSCMTTHKYVQHHESLRHVIKYGKTLYPGKMSYIHPVAAKTLKCDDLRLLGVAQLSAYDINIASAIVAALGITLAAYIDAVCEYLRPENIDHVLNGSLPKDITRIIRDAISGAEQGIVLHSSLQWAEMFIDITLKVYHVRVFVVTATPAVYTNAPGDRVTKNIIIGKIDKFYYPMTLERKQMIFETEEFVNTLYQICSQERSSELTLKHVMAVAKSHQWEIEAALVNRRNQCYAVIVKIGPDKAYISVDYVIETSIKHLEDPTAICNEVKLSTISGALGALQVEIQALLFAGPQFMGVRDSSGKHHYARIHDLPDSTLPHVDIKYDYLQINKAIISREPPSDVTRLSNYGAALYTTLEYRLFLLEFITYMESTVNTELRSKIKAIYLSSDFKINIGNYAKQLNVLLDNYNDDRNSLQKMFYSYLLGELTVEQLTGKIDNIRFTFDNTLMKQLQQLSNDALKSRLRELAESFAVTGEVTGEITFPNVYTQCNTTPGQVYCKGNKLVVTHLDDCINNLAADVKNELKMQYSIAYVRNHNILEYLTFRETGEVIEIYELSI